MLLIAHFSDCQQMDFFKKLNTCLNILSQISVTQRLQN